MSLSYITDEELRHEEMKDQNKHKASKWQS